MHGWQSCSHPEGRLYFHHPPSTEQKAVTALTNSILFDNQNLGRAGWALKEVEGLLGQYDETPEDTIVVLDIRLEACWYYCASWKHRRIFWPEETDVDLSIGAGLPVFDVSHLGKFP